MQGVEENANGEKLDDLDDESLNHLYNESTSLNKLKYQLRCVNDQIINSDINNTDVNYEINEQFYKFEGLDFSFYHFGMYISLV